MIQYQLVNNNAGQGPMNVPASGVFQDMAFQEFQDWCFF